MHVFQNDPIFYQFRSVYNPLIDRNGYTYVPIEIQVRLQLKSVNAIDLDEEFLDATVFMTFEWIDPNLAWDVRERSLNKNSGMVIDGLNGVNATHSYTAKDQNHEKPQTETITSIRVDGQKIWIPEIEIINRVFDFSPRDEIKRKLRVDFRGKVTYNRMYRLRTMMTSKIQRYPYDIQVSF